MTISSHQISGMMAAQTSMFSGQLAMSQQLAYPMMHHHYPGMGPPPAPASFSGEFDYGARIEQGVVRMGSLAANVGMPLMGAGLGIAGAMGVMGPLGRVFDPTHFLARGFSAGGLGGAMRALPMAIPHMALLGAAGSMVSAYGKAAVGGMQDQVMVNNMLRANFDFTGGGGFMGRGFSQQQMGQIGGLLHQTSRMDAFSPGMGELSSLVAQGKSMDMFTGVRDVQEFSRKFKEMISSLKTIQQELGGSLQEAMNFAQQARSSGLYNTADWGMFAQTVRRTADIAGISQSTVFQSAQFGSQLATRLGGRAAQGAMGAAKALQQVGAAVQGGILTPEMLAEATGGLTGDAATAAFAQNLMSRVAQRSRGGYERFSVFALANQDGTGIDSTMMGRYLSGDMSMQEIRSRAYQNARGMGRARAIRNEGLLRAGAIQEGGVMFIARRIMDQLGDRAMMYDDDTLGAVLQRRYRMSRGEADAVTALMRNMPEIGLRMAIDSESSDSEQAMARDMQRNRSFEGMKRQIGHYVAEATGVADAREWGRRVVSRFTSGMEKFVNDLFGIVQQELSAGGKETIRRVMMGRGTSEDFAKLEASMAALESFEGSRQLKGGLFQMGTPEGKILEALGYDVRSLRGQEGYVSYQKSIAEVNRLISGVHTNAEQARFAALKGSGIDGQVLAARMVSGGDLIKMAEHLRSSGIDPREALGYAASRGMSFDQLTGRLETGGFGYRGSSGDVSGWGGSQWSALAGTVGASTYMGAKIGSILGPKGTIAGAIIGGAGGLAYGIGAAGAERIVQALGYDYGGLEGASQYLEDSLDAHVYKRTRGDIEVARYRKDKEEVERLKREQKARMGIEEEQYEAMFRHEGARGLMIELLDGLTPDTALSEERYNELTAKLAGMNLDQSTSDAALNILMTGREGGLTDKMIDAIRVGVDPEHHLTEEQKAERRALAQKAANMRVRYGNIAGNLEGLSGTSGIVASLRAISESGDFSGVSGVIKELASLSPEEREAAYRAMGNDPEAMALRMGAQERVRSIANLSGGGYRGQRGARDSMFQHISGGLSDQLGIVLESGEGDNKTYTRINDRQGRRLLEEALHRVGKGGKVTKKQQAALDAYRRQFENMGLSEEDIDELMDLQSRVMKDGKIDTKEAQDILDAQSKERTVTIVNEDGSKTTKKMSIAEINREAQKQKARDADPLSAERNEYLKKMEEHTRGMHGFLRILADAQNNENNNGGSDTATKTT